MKNLFTLIALFFVLGFVCSQQTFTPYALLKIGYTNNNGNYLNAGASLYLVQKNENILHFSLSGNLSYMNENFIIIPESEISYLFKGTNGTPYSDTFDSAFYKFGVAASPYAIYPNLGITLLSLFEINAGYSFQYKDYENTSFEGFRLGVYFHIPTQVFAK